MLINKNWIEKPALFLGCMPNSRYKKPVYAVEEAAKKLGLDRSQVRRLLRSGEIEDRKFGRDWMVPSLDYKRKRKSKRKSVEGMEIQQCWQPEATANSYTQGRWI